jgi:predicted P-loop ATPase
LNEADYSALASRWVDRALAEAAGICRADSPLGATQAGRTDNGTYSGLLIPYLLPGEPYVREWRLRRDQPDLEQRDGKIKERGKYLSPPGRGNMLYFPPGDSGELLSSAEVPVIITEGEFKTLALWRLANDEMRQPRFLPIGLSGVWNWRGTVGKAPGPSGYRRDVKGVIPDFDRIAWQGRQVIVAFDADSASNEPVRIARHSLAKELRRRGAKTALLEWPAEWGKGVDDALANEGPTAMLKLVSELKYRDGSNWKADLLCNSRGAPKGNLHNAMLALREAPEWTGVLQFDEFAQKVTAAEPTPWGYTGSWNDAQDSELTSWLQKQGIEVSRNNAADAVRTVAADLTVNPLRDYLDSLVWDGQPRIDQWLTTYLGVPHTAHASTVGARWLISAVARGLSPGCKADVALVLEGPQGIGKSRALRALAGDWFTDHLPDLHGKDAMLQLQGVWIVELSELDTLSRADVGTVKAFLSSSTDRFRAPYGRTVQDLPRRCVFAGTSNRDDWHRDETGGRRFWPVTCSQVDIVALLADRDQLWAEAVARYRAGEPWWLEGISAAAAMEESARRQQPDPWQSSIETYIDARETTSVREILKECISKPQEHWTQMDQNRVAGVLRSLGWERVQIRANGTRERRYRRAVTTVTTEATDNW